MALGKMGHLGAEVARSGAPRMYGYKGVKWVERIVFTEKQETGYWEKFGYPSDGSIPGLKS